MEEWKPIIGYSNYAVSNLGNVRNEKKQKNLVLCLDTAGRPAVNIYNNGRKHIQVHILVANHFLENIDNLPVIDHINRDILDNRAENLRWVTQSQNQLNRIKKPSTSSRFKGVNKVEQGGYIRWRSRITVNRKAIPLGHFKTELEAGKAYNDFIIQHSLEGFAILNDLEERP